MFIQSLRLLMKLHGFTPVVSFNSSAKSAEGGSKKNPIPHSKNRRKENPCPFSAAAGCPGDRPRALTPTLHSESRCRHFGRHSDLMRNMSVGASKSRKPG